MPNFTVTVIPNFYAFGFTLSSPLLLTLISVQMMMKHCKGLGFLNNKDCGTAPQALTTQAAVVTTPPDSASTQIVQPLATPQIVQPLPTPQIVQPLATPQIVQPLATPQIVQPLTTPTTEAEEYLTTDAEEYLTTGEIVHVSGELEPHLSCPQHVHHTSTTGQTSTKISYTQIQVGEDPGHLVHFNCVNVDCLKSLFY